MPHIQCSSHKCLIPAIIRMANSNTYSDPGEPNALAIGDYCAIHAEFNLHDSGKYAQILGISSRYYSQEQKNLMKCPDGCISWECKYE